MLVRAREDGVLGGRRNELRVQRKEVTSICVDLVDTR
jgi:hypothetical protein